MELHFEIGLGDNSLNLKDKRVLKEYYRSLNLVEPLAPHFILDTFIFLFLLLLLLWFIPSLRIAVWGIIILLGLMVFLRYSKQKKRYIQIKKACFQKIADREYNKRVEKTSPDTLLGILNEEISKKFRISHLQLNNGMLEGRLLGEKIVVAYLDVHGEDIVTRREVLSVIRESIRRGILQIRIFTNGDFNADVSNLEKRYELNLRLYNGDMLQYLLKNTYLFPSVSQIKEIINTEMYKRQRKVAILKNEIMKKKKYSGYLFYSLLLLLMAKLGRGAEYLNIIAGLILLFFAITNILKNMQDRGKTLEPDIYFQKEGF
ncbi:MAG: hypothetical protein WCS56_05965 [Bacilli bacterium]